MTSHSHQGKINERRHAARWCLYPVWDKRSLLNTSGPLVDVGYWKEQYLSLWPKLVRPSQSEWHGAWGPTPPPQSTGCRTSYKAWVWLVYFSVLFYISRANVGSLGQRLSCVKDNSLLMLAITSRHDCFSNKLSKKKFRFSDICHFWFKTFRCCSSVVAGTLLPLWLVDRWMAERQTKTQNVNVDIIYGLTLHF